MADEEKRVELTQILGEACSLDPLEATALAVSGVMPAHRLYFITTEVNQTVYIRYRAAGFLGFMSGTTLRIAEGP